MDVQQALLSSPVAVVFAAVFGALWGSFFNVCIARIPRGMSLVRPGSHCLACGCPVRPWDNIPILSYFVLRGRCRGCGAPFSMRYAVVEALAAALGAAIWWEFVAADPGTVALVRLARFFLYFAFAGALLVLSFIDIDSKRLPDVITVPAIPILFVAAFGARSVAWQDRAIGAAAGYAVIWLIAELYWWLRRREGMGLGDGKLLAMAGAVFGWRALPVIIFIGSLLGVLVSIPLLLLARQRGAVPAAVSDVPPEEPSFRYAEIPFGPYLSVAAIVYLLAWDWFGRLFSQIVLH